MLIKYSQSCGIPYPAALHPAALWRAIGTASRAPVSKSDQPSPGHPHQPLATSHWQPASQSRYLSSLPDREADIWSCCVRLLLVTGELQSCKVEGGWLGKSRGQSMLFRFQAFSEFTGWLVQYHFSFPVPSFLFCSIYIVLSVVYYRSTYCQSVIQSVYLLCVYFVMSRHKGC